jgi:hypothetical protein
LKNLIYVTHLNLIRGDYTKSFAKTIEEELEFQIKATGENQELRKPMVRTRKKRRNTQIEQLDYFSLNLISTIHCLYIGDEITERDLLIDSKLEPNLSPCAMSS